MLLLLLLLLDVGCWMLDVHIRQVEAVATFAELSVPLTARLAELLGLPGPLTSATDQVWNPWSGD